MGRWVDNWPTLALALTLAPPLALVLNKVCGYSIAILWLYYDYGFTYYD